MAREFRLPDLGEGIAEAQVIRVLVKEGERIAEDHGLFEVETDKASVEIPSPFAGVVSKLNVAAGQTVNVGDVMIVFEGDGSPVATATSSRPPLPAPALVAPSPAAAPPTAQRTTAPAAPAIRKLARELGVDLDALVGSGPGGRVTKADVEAAVGQAQTPARAAIAARTAAPVARPAAPPPGIADADKWGKIRRTPLTQIRKTIAQQMVRSVSTIPHVTHIDQIDVTELERLRRQYKDASGGTKKVTAMAVIIRALGQALKNHPVFNASLEMDAGEIIYKDYINIGIAVDTERGLIVPNIRNADQLSVSQIAEALAKIADQARTNRFAIEDLRGGTFTLTNVGALGGTFSTPIINYPEAAILGLGKARETPVVKNGQIAIATIMPFSLSFDHRLADGAQAARFCAELMGYLENPVTLLFA